MDSLTREQLDSQIRNDISLQDYSKKPEIDGVKSVELKCFSGEDGTFEELFRFDNRGFTDLFPEFQIRQVNRSKLTGGSIKAWHIHLKQEDVWYVPPEDHMMLGLWDVRENSSSKNRKMRVIMGNGKSRLVYVPRGVAHGVVNWSKRSGTILYFVNNQFNEHDLDELRLPWDKAGKEFWNRRKE